MTCEEPGASSDSVIAAARCPVACGRKVTLMVQLVLAAIATLQFGAEKLKSLELLPVMAMLEM